jgi:OmcA/MtrC family decaheme c-type cytochrome
MKISRCFSSIRWGLAALLAIGVAGCGGGGGSDDAVTPATPSTAGSFTGTVQEGGGSIQGITINSPPVVKFKLQDSAGNPVQPTSLTQVRFALAKYVPGSPDRWIPFGVKTATTPDPTKFMTSNENRSCGQTGDGWAFANVKYDASTSVYSYYFCTDVTADANWSASATYRIGAELQFTDPVTSTVETSNPIVDFTLNQGIGQQLKDGSGNGMLVRKMVERAACNSCHNDLGQLSKFHGNRRIDPNYCVMCHNDSAYDPTTAVSLDMKLMIHKFHMGSHLLGSYAPAGLDATKMHFSQDQRNCTKCHTSAAIEGNQHVTAQGGNWKSAPSRNACGACHDGINFETGTGTTLSGIYPGHIGGAQADDSKCVLCHSATAIDTVYHQPITRVVSTSATTLNAVTYYAGNDNRLPTGAKTVDYDISSVSLNQNLNPVMVFRILQNGARMDLRTASSTTDDAIWANFSGAPTAYFAYSVPQDGVATPADFNAYVSTSLLGIWNGSATGTSAGTLTGPDNNGYYTLTLTGRTIPSGSSMLTGALGYAAMYQADVAGYVRTCTTTVKTN